MLAKMVQSMGLPIDIEVPVALIPFAGHGGATNLVYELHITNLAPVDLKLERIEVLDGSASLAAFAGAELDGILQSRGGSDPANKHRRWVLLFSFAHSLKAPPFARTVNSRRRTNARGCRRRSGLRSAC
jgi:hypothetical protein